MLSTLEILRTTLTACSCHVGKTHLLTRNYSHQVSQSVQTKKKISLKEIGTELTPCTWPKMQDSKERHKIVNQKVKTLYCNPVGIMQRGTKTYTLMRQTL
jgi:hypothetical protein